MLYLFSANVDDVYPVQLISGAPGSGNDWILWLGANIGRWKVIVYSLLIKHCDGIPLGCKVIQLDVFKPKNILLN